MELRSLEGKENLFSGPREQPIAIILAPGANNIAHTFIIKDTCFENSYYSYLSLPAYYITISSCNDIDIFLSILKSIYPLVIVLCELYFLGFLIFSFLVKIIFTITTLSCGNTISRYKKILILNLKKTPLVKWWEAESNKDKHRVRVFQKRVQMLVLP